MKTKIITLIAACAFLLVGIAGAQTPCSNDLNGFVNYKNTGGTGTCSLSIGSEEKASQTYNYSGPGKVASVRVYGNYPVSGFGGVPLRVGIYNVDLSGRPTTLITAVNDTWWGFAYNTAGYMTFTFPNGVTVSNRFAVTVEIRNNVFPNGTVFNLQYTGNGEGGNQDLASLAGTSTGFNWTSAKNSFGRNGDFYLVPTMTHQNNPGFTTSGTCYATGAPVLFSNTSQLTQDSMFNKIALTNYSGSNALYTWNFGDGSPVSHAATPTHAYATGGVYTVTLTTTIEGWTSNCVRTFTKTLSVGLNVSSSTVASISCFGASNGSFTANGQSGAPPYLFSINNSAWQNGPAFTGLTAGTYTLYIKDSKNCTNSTYVNISQPSGIIFTGILTGNATCGNANGSISSSASGGITPLQYKLDNGAFQSSSNFSGLSAQIHTLTVSDANSCTTTTPVIVNDLGGPVMGNISITNVSCYNGSDGSIVLSSSGGTGGTQYSINGGTTFQASPVFNAVGAGTYVCMAKDNAGCTDMVLVTIAQGQPLVLTPASVPAVCNGAANGQISVASAGGTGNHNYSLNGINYQSGTTFPGLSAGTYTVYVKDATSCVKTATVSVSQPPALSITLTSLAASCYGLSDGTISASGAGGNGNLVYSINGIDFQNPGSFMYLPAGTYTVRLKDMYACALSSTVNVSQPLPITTTVNTTNSTCTFTNGSIMVIAAGGSGSGYQFSINGGVTYTASGLFSALAAGTQYVVVKDGSGCQNVVSGTILDSNGPAITGSSQQNVSCYGGNDGSIIINSVSGGTGQLSYSKNGINWQASPVFNALNAGTYIIQVRDANGCIGYITKVITQPNGFLIVPATSSLSCYGGSNGSTTITASGGAGFLVYSINGGSSFQSVNVFNSLPAGNYSVIVKDAANCTATAAISILQPAELELYTMGVMNVTCNGANDGAIFVSAGGGNMPYLYNLSPGAYTASSSFTGLSGGMYLISVKDTHSCVVSHFITVNEPDALSVTPIINDIKCSGGNNGAISINVSGGIAPYTFQWSNGSLLSSVFNLGAGVYSVTVLDYNGCNLLNSYTLTQPANPLIVNGVVTPANSTNSSDGAVDVTVSGGVSPYTFNWSNGATSEDISNLNPGSYLLTITDANGCMTSSTFIVDNVTGLAGIQIPDAAVSIYPNPAANEAIVETEGYKISKIEVLNILGQAVLEGTAQNNNANIIKTAELTNGTYLIKVHVNGRVIIKRLIVYRS